MRPNKLYTPIERPLRVGILARLVVLALCVLTGCSQQFGEQRTPPPQPNAVASAKGRVDIEGGIIRLAARGDGVITNVMVEEGARVKAGQVLATLDDVLAQRNVTLARSQVIQAEQELKKTDIELQASEREFKRLLPLAQDDTVPRQDLDRARDARALAEVEALAARAAISTARARESVVSRELEERQIVAPLDGQIIQRQARPGSGVSTLNVTPLFLFLPDVPPLARAELEEQYLSVVTLGQRTEVILEADASKTWPGQVLRIGKVVGPRTSSEDPAEKQDNRVVEVVISFQADALLIGQRVIVRFLKP